MTRICWLAALLCLWSTGASAQFVLSPRPLQCTWTEPEVAFDEDSTARASVPSYSVYLRYALARRCGGFDESKCFDDTYLQSSCFNYHRSGGASCESVAVAAISAAPQTLTVTPVVAGSARQALLSRAVAPTTAAIVSTDWSSFSSVLDYHARHWPSSGKPYAFRRMDDDGGTSIDTCFEYAYERHWDAAELRLSALRHVDDPRAFYDEVFAAGGVGTRSSDGVLRSRDTHQQSGQLFGDEPLRRSAFFALGADGWGGDHNLGYGTGHQAARRYALAPLLNKLRDNYRADDRSFLYHRIRESQLRTMVRHAPAGVDTGLCGYDRTTGYTDEELGYLHDLGKRFLALLADHEAELRRPRWELSVGDGFGVGDDLVAAPLPYDTSARAAIEDEIIEVLEEADSWGCLEAGVTACDWSPQAFAEELRDGFHSEMESAMDWCEELAINPYDLDEHMGSVHFGVYQLTPAPGIYIAPECLELGPLRRGACQAASGLGCPGDDCAEWSQTLDLTQSPAWLEFYPTFARAYQQAVRRATAKSSGTELMALDPNMVDDQGDPRPPNFEFSRTERMGNEYFGLTYEVSAGMGVSGGFVGGYGAGAFSERLCGAGATEPWVLEAGAHFEAVAHVLGTNTTIVEAELSAASREGGASSESASWGGLAGLPVFEGGGAQTDFNFVHVDQTIANIWVSVLGIPINVRAGIAGRAGFAADVSVTPVTCDASGTPTSGARAAVIPTVEVHGFVSAAVDAYVARAGVKGELEIVHADMPVSIAVETDGAQLSVANSAELNLSTLSGRIAAFAEINYYFGSKSAEFTLVSWTGPSWNETLYEAEPYSVSFDMLRQGL